MKFFLAIKRECCYNVDYTLKTPLKGVMNMQGTCLIEKNNNLTDQIEVLRREMTRKVIDINMLRDEQTLKASQELDTAIVNYMKSHS